MSGKQIRYLLREQNDCAEESKILLDIINNFENNFVRSPK